MFTTAKAVTIQATMEKWDMFETNGRGVGGGGGGVQNRLPWMLVQIFNSQDVA